MSAAHWRRFAQRSRPGDWLSALFSRSGSQASVPPRPTDLLGAQRSHGPPPKLQFELRGTERGGQAFSLERPTLVIEASLGKRRARRVAGNEIPGVARPSVRPRRQGDV